MNMDPHGWELRGPFVIGNAGLGRQELEETTAFPEQVYSSRTQMISTNYGAIHTCVVKLDSPKLDLFIRDLWANFGLHRVGKS
jgi:hypothetical protein